MLSANGPNGPWITQDQWMGFARWAISFGTGIAVGKGWMTTSDAASLGGFLLQIAGPVGAIGAVVWTYIANGRHSILASAANNPTVQQITVSTPEVANSVTSDKVVNGTQK